MNWKRVFSQRRDSKATLLAGFLASSVLFSMASAQAAPQNAPEQKPAASAQSKPSSGNGVSRRLPKVGMPASARQYYQLTFGVDNLSIKSVESGSMLRFSYHVLNAAKAQALNDKKATPYLYDLKSRARLEVPSMEKVGQLPEFSGSGRSHVLDGLREPAKTGETRCARRRGDRSFSRTGTARRVRHIFFPPPEDRTARDLVLRTCLPRKPFDPIAPA